jgi:hypothetical protein
MPSIPTPAEFRANYVIAAMKRIAEDGLIAYVRAINPTTNIDFSNGIVFETKLPYDLAKAKIEFVDSYFSPLGLKASLDETSTETARLILFPIDDWVAPEKYPEAYSFDIKNASNDIMASCFYSKQIEKIFQAFFTCQKEHLDNFVLPELMGWSGIEKYTDEKSHIGYELSFSYPIDMTEIAHRNTFLSCLQHYFHKYDWEMTYTCDDAQIEFNFKSTDYRSGIDPDLPLFKGGHFLGTILLRIYLDRVAKDAEEYFAKAVDPEADHKISTYDFRKYIRVSYLNNQLQAAVAEMFSAAGWKARFKESTKYGDFEDCGSTSSASYVYLC